MKKILLLLILSLTLIGCSNSSTNPKLVISTSSGYAPYEMIDPQGNLIGFDIDLGNLIAEKMGREVEWKDMSFDGVIASLSANQADMAIAGLSPDPKRDALFSHSYYLSQESPFYIVTTEASNIKNTSDLMNKTVGVQIATIQEAAANQLKQEYNLTIDSRDAYHVMVQEVLLNRLDFLIMEPMIAQEYLHEYPELIMFELEEESLEEIAGNSIALPKNSELLEEVNQILDELKADGTLDALIDKWFNEQ